MHTHHLADRRWRRRLARRHGGQRRRLRADWRHYRWDYRRPHRWLVITAARHCNRRRNYRCDYQCLHRRSHLATYSAIGQAGGLASRSRNLVVLGTAPPLRRCGIRPAGNRLPQSWPRQAPTIRFQAPQPRRWPGPHSLDSLDRRLYQMSMSLCERTRSGCNSSWRKSHVPSARMA